MARRFAFLLAIAVLLALLVLALSASSVQAGFPGYNGKIAYASGSGAPDDPSDIWVMDPDGRHKEKLTSEPPAMKIEPTWSPDGTRLAFRTLVGNDIYVFDLGTGTATNLTADIEEFAMYPAWSPDGAMLAFTLVSTSTGAIDLYTILADGSELTRLTNTGDSDEEMPAWSPDGQKIAFRSRDLGFVSDIAVVNADGSERTNITNDAAYDSSPAWSPDGEEIAFSSGRVRGDQKTDIFIMKADGSDVRRVSESPLAADGPEWSPDGRYLLYTTTMSSMDIYRVQASGGMPLRLTASPAHESDPSWQAASTPPPPEAVRSLTVTPSSGIVGTTAFILAEGCGEPGETVVVAFEKVPDDQIPGRNVVSAVPVDSTGRFETAYTIPDQIDSFSFGVRAVSSGRYVFAVDPSGCEASFTVAGTAETGPSGPVAATELPAGGGPPGRHDDLKPIDLGAAIIALSSVFWAAALTDSGRNPRRPPPGP